MARTAIQWAYDYEDLSRLTDLSLDAIRQAKSRGDFNPEIFGSVLTWVAKHGNMHIRREIMEALLVRQYPKSKQTEETETAAMVDEFGRMKSKKPKRLVPSPIEDAPKKKSPKSNRARS